MTAPATALNVKFIEMAPYLAAMEQPIFMLPRDAPGHDRAWAGQTEVAHRGAFWVPAGSVLDPKPDWRLTRAGEAVRVPIVAYRTSYRALSAILATGMQLGLAAVLSLRQYTAEPPKTVTLVLGDVCQDLGAETGYRCFVGIAVKVGQANEDRR